MSLITSSWALSSLAWWNFLLKSLYSCILKLLPDIGRWTDLMDSLSESTSSPLSRLYFISSYLCLVLISLIRFKTIFLSRYFLTCRNRDSFWVMYPMFSLTLSIGIWLMSNFCNLRGDLRAFYQTKGLVSWDILTSSYFSNIWLISCLLFLASSLFFIIISLNSYSFCYSILSISGVCMTRGTPNLNYYFFEFSIIAKS